MRHRKKKGILDRKKSSRESLLRNLAGQLIEFERIKTTEAKARILKPIAEKLLTSAKNDTITSRRMVKKFIYQEKLIKKLFSDLAPRFHNRNSGYLRISKINNRKGDGAPIVQIEIIKDDEKKLSKKSK